MLLKSLLNKYSRDENGATTIVYAVALPLLVGMGALAFEAGHIEQREARIQSAADMAAMAAALEFSATSNRAKARLAGKGDAYENGYVPQGGSFEVESPITSGPHAGSEGAIVRITQVQERYLSKIFPSNSEKVHIVEATVVAAPGKPVCALSLHPTNAGSMEITGSADVEMESCSMHANSTADGAFNLSGSGSVTADCVSATGTVTASNRTVLPGCDNTPRSNAPAINDPYADIAVPANVMGMACQTPAFGRGSVEMSPGRYCANKDYGINGVLNLSTPGVYIFDGINGGANIFVKSRGSIYGTPDGVTLIFMNGAQLENTNGGEMELYAQPDGPYAGVLIYADRDTSVPGATVRINGNQGARFEGALYFPTQTLDFRGGADLDSDCTQIIASQVIFSGNSALTNRDCGPRGTRSIVEQGSGVRLVN